MANLHNQKGSGHIVAIVGVLVIAVVAFAGYRVLSASKTDASNDTSAVKTSSAEVAAPATVKTKADVTKATSALDSTEIDGSLNSDINNL
jgi:hypothetical protein